MNILLTLNKNYLIYMISLIRSIQDSNTANLEFYIFSNDIKQTDIDNYSQYLRPSNKYHIISIPKTTFANAPISTRYPYEMYYRIFASKFLPDNLDKILYLDPDIIVKGDISELYNLDLKDNYYAGACNIRKIFKKINQIKNGAPKDAEYINTGVLLINLKELRIHQKEEEVFAYIEERKNFLTLPDQDIISALYGEKIILIDKLVYNLADRTIRFNNYDLTTRGLKGEKIDLQWVEDHTKIIHYFGKNKPWRKNYKGILGCYYEKYKVEKAE